MTLQSELYMVNKYLFVFQIYFPSSKAFSVADVLKFRERFKQWLDRVTSYHFSKDKCENVTWGIKYIFIYQLVVNILNVKI